MAELTEQEGIELTRLIREGWMYKAAKAKILYKRKQKRLKDFKNDSNT